MSQVAESTDVTIIGGGIVGLATAYALTRSMPHVTVRLLEKERSVGQHQTAHNSGVLHTGIYYRPGSIRARTSRTGKKLMEAFCAREGVDFKITGKVIVATDEAEIPRLEALFERGRANGVDCDQIGPAALRTLEPNVFGIRAIHVREAGVVNYGQVAARLADIIGKAGVQIATNARVSALTQNGDQAVVHSSDGCEHRSAYVVNCAGLYADRIAKLTEKDLPLQIIPFRGEYYRLKPEAAYLCRALVYPVPDPQFPFLGVHFTRSVDGEVECGPNAVLALAREGYRWSNVNPGELLEAVSFKGFRKLAFRHWRTGLGEIWRSLSRAAFVRSLQKLIPEIREEHVERAPAGVRAQGVSPDGYLVDDFVVSTAGRVVNVVNAPSPAATASLAIGELIVDQLRAAGLDVRPAIGVSDGTGAGV